MLENIILYCKYCKWYQSAVHVCIKIIKTNKYQKIANPPKKTKTKNKNNGNRVLHFSANYFSFYLLVIF